MKLQRWDHAADAIPTLPPERQDTWRSPENRTAFVTLVSGVTIASLLTLLIAWCVFSIVSDFTSVTMRRARSHEVIATLNRLQMNLAEAEKSERGYVIGSEFSSAPYEHAVEEARWTTDLIFALSSNDPIQRVAAASLDKLVQAKLRTLQLVVEVREASRPQSAQLLMSLDQDKRESDRIISVLKRMEDRENMLLDEALLVRDRAYCKLWGMLAAVTVALFAGAAWHYRRVRGIVRQAAISQAEIQHLANHDVLTGLPNRRLLDARLAAQIAGASEDGQSLAVMYMDLDGFKMVNDTIGHDAGDELLQQVARRMKATLRAGDTVARIGGDEFVIVVPNLHGANTAAQIAGALANAISEPYAIKGRPVCVSASIGISIYPMNGTGASELLNVADQALNQAKHSGKNQYRFAHARPVPSAHFERQRNG